MTHSNAAMVLIIAATIAVGCSSQHPAPEAPAPLPPIQLRVIDADTGKPLEGVSVFHWSNDIHRDTHQGGFTDANGEFQVGPQNRVGDKVWMALEECDPDGTVEAHERRLLLGSTAAAIDEATYPKKVDTTVKTIAYSDDHHLVVGLKREKQRLPDTFGQQWISETKFLKCRMSMHEALTLLEAHGFHESDAGRAGPPSDCCRRFSFTSDRYPDRFLELDFRRQSLIPNEAPPGAQDDDLLIDWQVINQITGTFTTDPAVWKAAR